MCMCALVGQLFIFMLKAAKAHHTPPHPSGRARGLVQWIRPGETTAVAKTKKNAGAPGPSVYQTDCSCCCCCCCRLLFLYSAHWGQRPGIGPGLLVMMLWVFGTD
uniref:Putative secreted protein n=1 Tax=Anopheles darlingi TaxID=43151 RepID=A0A2M4D8Q0_ANODA